MALDNPHEAGPLSAAILVEVDLGGVVDDDPSKVLGCIAPPLALLRPITVAASLGLRGEADDSHTPTVVGDPRRGTEPAVGIGSELTLPATQIPADPRWVGRPTLDDPDEHEPPYILLIRRYRVMSGSTLPAKTAPSPTAAATSNRIFIWQVSSCPHHSG